MKLEGKDLEIFLQCCKEAGAKVTKVTPGTGKVTLNGKPIDVKAVLDAGFPGKDGETHA